MPRPAPFLHPEQAQRFARTWRTLRENSLRGYHAYASWLVGISWRRFIVLAMLLLVAMAMLKELPPFAYTTTEAPASGRPIVVMPRLPPLPRPPAVPTPAAPAASGAEARPAGAAASASQAAREAASAADAVAVAAEVLKQALPAQAQNETLRDALRAARREMEDAVREARQDAEQAARDAEQARRDAQQAIEEISRELGGTRVKQHRGLGDLLMNLTLLWIAGSAVLKYTYKGRLQAEVKAAQATETAEAESLRRQVVEARMAAMQAQVEPHFLFNTLASIDHLIETDPPRASLMQKNLIALLRASMPTMREAKGEASANGVRDLGRELAVIRPYLEILKVRMEERLATTIDVPDGLLSAEFPPLMIQTLVENAIKHGLEPKPEGGTLTLKADVVHGKLQVRVADTGLGFGMAATAGTGVGLANIRERLQLLYGARASLTITANQPSGTVASITVPYKTVEGTPA